MRVIRTAWRTFVIAFLVMAAIASGSLLAGVRASARPLDEMKLGEFTMNEWFVQTGCVSNDPAKPSFVEFSSVYIGTQDAILQIVRIDGDQMFAPMPPNLIVTVSNEQIGGPYAILTANAHQMFDLTVRYVQPNDTYAVYGRHLGSFSTTLLAKWTAAERNECTDRVEQTL